MDDDVLAAKGPDPAAVASTRALIYGNLVDEATLARALKKDRRTIKRWRRAGKLPFKRIGEREIAYDPVAVRDALIKPEDDRAPRRRGRPRTRPVPILAPRIAQPTPAPKPK